MAHRETDSRRASSELSCAVSSMEPPRSFLPPAPGGTMATGGEGEGGLPEPSLHRALQLLQLGLGYGGLDEDASGSDDFSAKRIPPECLGKFPNSPQGSTSCIPSCGCSPEKLLAPPHEDTSVPLPARFMAVGVTVQPWAVDEAHMSHSLVLKSTCMLLSGRWHNAHLMRFAMVLRGGDGSLWVLERLAPDAREDPDGDEQEQGTQEIPLAKSTSVKSHQGITFYPVTCAPAPILQVMGAGSHLSALQVVRFVLRQQQVAYHASHNNSKHFCHNFCCELLHGTNVPIERFSTRLESVWKRWAEEQLERKRTDSRATSTLKETLARHEGGIRKMLSL